MTIGLLGDSRRIRTLTMALALAVAAAAGTVGVLAAHSQPAGTRQADPGAGPRGGGPLTGAGANNGANNGTDNGGSNGSTNAGDPSAQPGPAGPVVTGAVGAPVAGSPAPEDPAHTAAAPQGPPALRAPGAPTGLTASPGDGKATLCWTPPARADGYAVYQRDATAGEAWRRLPYPVPGPCWTGGLLVNGHTYQYRVLAGNPAGESGFSNTASVQPAGTRPGAPTGLTATPAGNAQAKLCWHAGPHATGYVVYVRDVTSGAAWTRLPYPVPGPCWTGGLLVNGDRYAFKLRSGNAYGESGFSNTAEVIPHP